jgi:uncharacterized protein (DUF2147 family)
MKQKKSVFFATLLGIIFLAASATSAPTKNHVANPPKSIQGFWYTENRRGGVELYSCGDQICGRFQWISDEEGPTSRDDNNPDPALRQRPLCHMQFMNGFASDPDQKNHFIDGTIYNPHDGGLYSAEMTLVDENTLRLRGYLFLPFLGESQIWRRAKTMPSCASG